MNVVKFLTKLYEGDSYLQAFLGKVAKDIEAGAPPIKAFADEAGRLSVVLGVQKAARKEVATSGQVAPVKRKAAPRKQAVVETKTRTSAAVKAEALTVADGPKPHRGRPTNAERAARALMAKSVPDEGQAQVIKVGDQPAGRGRRNVTAGLPFVPDEGPTAGEVSDSVLSMS